MNLIKDVKEIKAIRVDKSSFLLITVPSGITQHQFHKLRKVFTNAVGEENAHKIVILTEAARVQKVVIEEFLARAAEDLIE